ncbi:MAG: CTB family bacteriocin [Gloeotrichia echinulata IR180]|jgi:hypothetical protein|nr:CTB family bacteriocin [Gloeotrichia echinulata DEX184]
MSNHIIISDWFVELSEQQQQMLSGGQNLVLPGGSPIGPLGRARTDGSETEFSDKTVQGVTTSGPLGSIGNSLGQASGAVTGATDSMILPPFIGSSETFN